MADHAARPGPRLILLLGTPRSGTTWLASLLNSYEGAVYSHEPLDRLHLPRLEALVGKVKETGTLEPDERRQVLWEWSRAHHACRRPPFFAKSFTSWPASMRQAAWLLVRLTGVGEGAFCSLFSPRRSDVFDLVVKNVDWSRYAGRIVSALAPLLVVIMRHPCGVVASLLRGQSLGLMTGEDRRQWLEAHGPTCDRLGFSGAAVHALEPCAFLSLGWLVQNTEYLELVERHPSSRLVVYEELCRAPDARTREVFDFLGWVVGPQTARFIRKSTASSPSWLTDWLQAKHPYFSVRKKSLQAADSWKAQLTPRQQEQVLGIARAFPRFEECWGDSAAGGRFPGKTEAASYGISSYNYP